MGKKYMSSPVFQIVFQSGDILKEKKDAEISKFQFNKERMTTWFKVS